MIGKKLAQSNGFEYKLDKAREFIDMKNRNLKPCNHCKEYNSHKGRCDKYLIWVEGDEYEYCGNTVWQVQ